MVNKGSIFVMKGNKPNGLYFLKGIIVIGATVTSTSNNSNKTIPDYGICV